MSSFKMSPWAAALDVPFINNKPRSHKPSLDRRRLPTYEEVMQMTRVKREVLNTPLSKFAPTGIHVGAIILGPDRWREIGQWVVESGSMQMPSEKVELDDQVHNKPADVESAIFENVCFDETVVPEDSVTKWDRDDDDPELDEWDVPSYVKPTPERNKRTGVYNLIELNLWRLEESSKYNPAIRNRATKYDIALFNSFYFEPHRHRRRYCRRCARRAHTRRNVAGLEEWGGWIIESVTQEDKEEVPGWIVEPVTQVDEIQEDELRD